jgi:site-specific recombinase XerD
MASIYKLGRDKKKKHALYWISYFDHNGKRQMKKGFTDKALTEQLAAKLENEVLLRQSGMVDSQQEEFAKRKRSGIAEHMDDFEKSLARKKNTAKHVRITIRRVQRIVDGCAFKTLGDIKADAVEQFLDELRREMDLGHRTLNHFSQAFEQFCSYLTKKGRLATNPVNSLHRLNCETDVRHKRRALTQEEFGKLVQSARESTKKIQCYDGETRTRIYLLSYFTGLRRIELASLMPSSFKLDEDPAKLTVEATISKHRKMDVLPLHPDLVIMLREWIQGRASNEKLFPKLAKRRTWRMVKLDLERVGIPYVTDEGIADFHAAGRHTYITELIRSGASLPQAMQLARHTDIKMTMKYTHVGMDEQAKALAGLPTPCQHIVSSSGVLSSLKGATGVSPCHTDENILVDASPLPMSPLDTEKQKETPPVKGGVSWRRRESNPRPVAARYAHLRV